MSESSNLNAAWLWDPAVRRVFDALAAEGGEARFVGGCVRDALLKRHVEDLDLAFNRPPDETTRLLEQAGLRVAPTGIDHGTVTAVTEDAQGRARALEITSLRRDVQTDGRRAVVSFTQDWAEDALRRDLTMNALYADCAGRVFDPTGEGLDDLAARRVRFIGAPEDRIREDYLRILRFFRFAAWYGEGALDRPALSAISALAGGVEKLARERVGHELRKLFAAPDPSGALNAMAETGALTPSLPDADPAALPKLLRAERTQGVAPDWRRRVLACFIPAPGLVKRIAEAMRLTRTESKALEARLASRTLPPRAAGWTHGVDVARDALLLRQIQGETIGVAAWREAALGAAAEFPVTAKELIRRGVKPGPALGKLLRKLQQIWLDHEQDIDRDTLLRRGLDKGP